ncbi:hypothetical protein [Mesorhizobium jarvisii]|uniref:hypothetical protein n=1 Tax=Mesorhizobium jarvisii TaxID=1777867 RepID=UPI001F0A81E4|nr:hypothetical protein [Mesorhizobium jarvisii]MCH4560324.1 hypothetical protein [Mesorhizobium jarvisii]
MAESEKEHADRIRLAERSHAARRDDIKLLIPQIQAYAVDGMKAPGLAAAAGVAAALGYYSANYTRLSANPENLITFNAILFWLFASLLFTVIAPGMAYFSQISYATSWTYEKYNYEHPFVHDTAKSLRFARIGHAFRWVTIAIVFGSIACIARAGYLFLRVVS